MTKKAFATWYDPVMLPFEYLFTRRIRKQLTAKAKGEVLEIGAGTGLNFSHYPAHIQHITALEPNEWLQKKASERAIHAHLPIDILQGKGEHLPFENDTFDTVVLTLVFCTIDDPITALKEIERVLKPGGKLLLFEHVRLQSPFLGWLQDKITPAWQRIADGCRLNRDTLHLIKARSFDIITIKSIMFGLFIVVDARITVDR